MATATAFSMFSLEGQTALVTGGPRGIGQAAAIALAECGADIILIQVNSTYMRFEAELSESVADILIRSVISHILKLRKLFRLWGGKLQFIQRTSRHRKRSQLLRQPF